MAVFKRVRTAVIPVGATIKENGEGDTEGREGGKRNCYLGGSGWAHRWVDPLLETVSFCVRLVVLSEVGEAQYRQGDPRWRPHRGKC